MKTKMKSLILICFLIGIFSSDVFPQINVSATGGTPTATYSTLTNAFSAINSGTHSGSVTITVTASTLADNTSAVLNASGSGSANYTSVLIRPGSLCTPLSPCLIQGNTNQPKIDFNGADNVTLEGGNVNGDFALQIDNTNNLIASFGAVRFINDASNNIIRNAKLFARTSNTSSGVVLFGTGTTTGNDNNTVQNCDIASSSTTALPSRGVVGLGSSSSIVNNNNTITENLVHDFFLVTANVSGIDIGIGNDAWTITKNRIYQSSPRTFSSSSLIYRGINVNNSDGNGFVINDNVVGFSNLNQGGQTNVSGVAATFLGIDVLVGSLTPTEIHGNRIGGINFSTTLLTYPFAGIRGLAGSYNIGTTKGNLIGSMTTTDNIVINVNNSTSNSYVTGIFDISESTSPIEIRDNQIGGITVSAPVIGNGMGFAGIYSSKNSSGTPLISRNKIGGNVANSINVLHNGANLIGVVHEGNNTPPVTIRENLVKNMTNAGGSGTTSGITVRGLNQNNYLITQNTVHSLVNSNSSLPGTIIGIHVSDSNAQGTVSRNNIHSLFIDGTTALGVMYGIIAESNVSTYTNNFVRLGLDKNGNSIAGRTIIYGIFEGRRQNFINNSVYVGGNSSNQVESTFAFFSNVGSSPRSYINNIFSNERVKTGGTGFNYGVRYFGGGFTANYNLIYVSDVNSFIGQLNSTNVSDLGTWQALTLEDSNSIDSNPLFLNPTGTALTGDLHIPNNSPAKGAGTTVVNPTVDFDGQDRPDGTEYDIGADETMILILDDSDLGFGTVGFGFFKTFTADLGIPSYTWSLTGGTLPPGIMLDSNTGTISGIPTAEGLYTFTITATDGSPPLLTEKTSSEAGAPNTHSKEFQLLIIAAPTAAPAEIGGRLTTTDGRGIRNAQVVLFGGNLSEPRYALTNSFGYYKFEDLPLGQTYIVSAESRRFTFVNPQRVIDLQDNITDADFVANPEH